MTSPQKTPPTERAGGLRPSEVLERAADLIEPEGAWTQGVLARHDNGRPISPLSPRAVCWCAAGAIARARGDDTDPYDNLFVEAALRAAPRQYRQNQIWDWNDDRLRDRRNQVRIVTVLRKAAELARSEGQ